MWTRGVKGVKPKVILFIIQNSHFSHFLPFKTLIFIFHCLKVIVILPFYITPSLHTPCARFLFLVPTLFVMLCAHATQSVKPCKCTSMHDIVWVVLKTFQVSPIWSNLISVKLLPPFLRHSTPTRTRTDRSDTCKRTCTTSYMCM